MSSEHLMDDATFEIFFKEHFSPLCAWCQYKFGFELDVAREAVNSGFIKLWENRHSLSEGRSGKAYLYTIVTNISLDMIRHEKIKKKYALFVSRNTSDVTNYEAFNKHDLKQLEADIDKAISELPEQMQRIFELSRYEGLKYSEIATKLNISIKTVETQMSRALAKLRQQLAHYITALITVVFLLL